MSDQLSIFDAEAPPSFSPEPVQAPTHPRLPLPHHVRVPVGIGNCGPTADVLHKVITRLYEATGDQNAFRVFCEAVMAMLDLHTDPSRLKDVLVRVRKKALEPDEAIKAIDEGFHILVDHFWTSGEFYDVLGDAYMRVRSDWAGKALGQYFTPWSMCLLNAKTAIHDLTPERLKSGEPLSVYDPACGSGALLLACKAAIVEAHGDKFEHPRKSLHSVRAYGQDLDHVCFLMAKIQTRMCEDRWMTSYMLVTIPTLFGGMK